MLADDGSAAAGSEPTSLGSRFSVGPLFSEARSQVGCLSSRQTQRGRYTFLGEQATFNLSSCWSSIRGEGRELGAHPRAEWGSPPTSSSDAQKGKVPEVPDPHSSWCDIPVLSRFLPLVTLWCPFRVNHKSEHPWAVPHSTSCVVLRDILLQGSIYVKFRTTPSQLRVTEMSRR